jgi:WD40 repeat protein
MTRRPLSVSIICWLTIAIGIIELIVIPFEVEIIVFLGNHHLPLPLKIALLGLGALAQIIGAIGMFRAQNWARYLSLASILPVAFEGYVGAASFIGPLVITAVQALFLFGPKANEYFSQPKSGIGFKVLRLPLYIALFFVIALTTGLLIVDHAHYSGFESDNAPHEVRRLKAEGPINAVAWNADGSRLAALSSGGLNIRVWDAKTWKVIDEFQNPGASYANNSLAFLPDGSILTTPKLAYGKSHLCSLVQWNPGTGKPVREIPDVCYPDRKDDVVGITDTYAVTKDGSLIAGIGGKVGLMIFDGHAGTFVKALQVPRTPNSSDFAMSVAFSPDGQTLAVGTGFGYVHFYDLQSGLVTHSFAAYESSYNVHALAFSPDGQYIATGKYKGINVQNPNAIGTNIWQVKDGSPVAALPDATLELLGKDEAVGVWNVLWNPSGDILAVGDGRSLRLWRITLNSQTLILKKPSAQGPYGMAYSPDGILAATDNNEVMIYQ